MDVFQIVHEYVDRMLPVDGSMKVLLLDADTLNIISVAYSQTDLLHRGVFLVDQVSNTERRKMPTMRCVIFVRPTSASVNAVQRELAAANYSSYSLNFSNSVATEQLDSIARQDKKELVIRVEECYADFIAVNADMFTAPVLGNPLSPSMVSQEQLLRCAQSIAAACVANRRRPHIRVQKTSAYAKALSTTVTSLFKGDQELYDFRSRDTLLMIIDRTDDPVTPLLTPWTYQAMLHELVGMEHNKVSLPGATAEETLVFSQHDDNFFAQNMFKNWGDLCGTVKEYVDQCKALMNIDRSTATIEEVKQFMQKLPQTKQLTSSVTKHATIVSHLSDCIKARNLLEVSLLEQDIVATRTESDHWDRLQALAANPKTQPQDLLRLCLLFNLRYEKTASPSKVEKLLAAHPQRAMVRKLREYFGETRPTDLLFASAGMMASVVSFVKGMSDVGNIYTQHVPVLKKHMQSLVQGKLDLEAYPFVTTPAPPATFRPKELILFVVGGVTLEEAAMVNQWNAELADGGAGGAAAGATRADAMRVIIAGTGIHNTATFIEALDRNP